MRRRARKSEWPVDAESVKGVSCSEKGVKRKFKTRVRLEVPHGGPHSDFAWHGVVASY